MKQIIDALHLQMNKTIAGFKSELVKIRTGRATPSLLDGVKVDYYGSMTPLSQVASVSCPEPRLIQIQPWETGLLQTIEKAILVSDLGLTPQNDGKVIRVPLPPFTEERRKELVKFVKKLGEDCKVSLRTHRRDANEEVKKHEKEKKVSMDEAKKASEQVQKKTDEFVAEVDKILAAKEKDILSI